jgi:hypothetical protein
MPLGTRILAWGSRHPALATAALCIVGQSLLVWLWSSMDNQSRSAYGSLALSLVGCAFVGAGVIRFVFTPPRVRTRVLRGLGVVVLQIPLRGLVLPLVSSEWYFVSIAFAVLLSSLFSGVIGGLVCGTISVCIRRWVGGTLAATAAGSMAGFLAGAVGIILFLRVIGSLASDRVPLTLLGIMYSSLLLGALLGAYAGARWSRGRVVA